MTTAYERRGVEVTPGALPHAMRGYGMMGYPVQGYAPQPSGNVVIIVNAPVGAPLPDWRSAYSQPHPPAYMPRPVPARALVILLALVIIGAALTIGARAMGALPWQQEPATIAGVPVETGGMSIAAEPDAAQWPWQAGYTWPWERAAADAADAAQAVQGTVTTVSTAILGMLVLLILLALISKWRGR